MSPIAKALHRARQQHLATLKGGHWVNGVPGVYHHYITMMLRISVRIDSGVAPGGRVRVKGGGA